MFNLGKEVKEMVKIVMLVGFMILSAAAASQDVRPIYQLRAGDEISLKYRYTPDFDQAVKIQPDGYVSLELAGECRLAGLTLAQARELIVERVKNRLKDPELSVTLKEFESPFFVVAGEVVKPGKFELRGEMTALRAVMMAGGFSDRAKTSAVAVVRRLPSGSSETRVLDLKGATRKTGTAEDLNLQAGDVVIVPQNNITRIERVTKAANLGLFFNPLQWLF